MILITYFIKQLMSQRRTQRMCAFPTAHGYEYRIGFCGLVHKVVVADKPVPAIPEGLSAEVAQGKVGQLMFKLGIPKIWNPRNNPEDWVRRFVH